MNNTNDRHQADELDRHKINLETGEIGWQELQRHFASGRLVSVAHDLDLVAVAHEFFRDNKKQLEQWLTSGRVHPVSDSQAARWHEAEASLWAVVIKPWVLVQGPEGDG